MSMMNDLPPLDHEEDASGRTLIMRAAYAGMAGNFDAIKFLLHAHSYLYHSDDALIKVDKAGNSALHLALLGISRRNTTLQQAREKAKIARLLIRHGADLFLENKKGERPLDYVGKDAAAMFSLPWFPKKELRNPREKRRFLGLFFGK